MKKSSKFNPFGKSSTPRHRSSIPRLRFEELEELGTGAQSSKLQKGFTLLELTLVIGLLSAIFGFITVNLLNVKNRASLNASVTTVITDFKQQQLKAMIGDTEGRESSDHYGIRFEHGKYIFFNGSSYVANPSNFEVILSDSIQIANHPKTVIFTKGSGEVMGYDPLQNTIVLHDATSSQQKTLEFNRYGAITVVN